MRVASFQLRTYWVKEWKILELCLLVGEEFRSELLVEEIDCCVSSMLASEQLRQYVGVGH